MDFGSSSHSACYKSSTSLVSRTDSPLSVHLYFPPPWPSPLEKYCQQNAFAPLVTRDSTSPTPPQFGSAQRTGQSHHLSDIRLTAGTVVRENPAFLSLHILQGLVSFRSHAQESGILRDSRPSEDKADEGEE